MLYAAAFLLLLALVAFVFNFARNGQCSMSKQIVTVHNLGSDLENWSILHISDLNAREIGTGQSAVKKAIGTKAFSCVVMTGDMVGKSGNIEPLLELIDILPGNTPILIIPGDCDPPIVNSYATDSLNVYASWVCKLQDKGVVILDRPVSFTRGKNTIWFVPEELYSLDIDGTLSAFLSQERELTARQQLTADESARLRMAQYQIVRMREIKEICREMKESDIQVCVSHIPLTSEYISTMYSWQEKDRVLSFHNVALILSGHYAGGQWRLPKIGALYVPEIGFFPDDSEITGMSYVAGIPQYISPGLGDSSFYPFPGRLFNSPEISQIVLTASYK